MSDSNGRIPVEKREDTHPGWEKGKALVVSRLRFFMVALFVRCHGRSRCFAMHVGFICDLDVLLFQHTRYSVFLFASC